MLKSRTPNSYDLSTGDKAGERAITFVKSTGLDRCPSSCEMEKAHLERLTEERF